MGGGNYPGGSKALSDDTERRLGGSPQTPILEAAAPTELSQKDEVHLAGGNIVDFDGDNDPANPLSCKPFLEDTSQLFLAQGDMKMLILNCRVLAVQVEYYRK